MQEVYFSKKIEDVISKLDFSRLGKNVAIKLHFGEKGCVTYVNPKIVRKVYDKIISLGKKATLVECNVLYKGERTRATSHIKLAREHGFDFAPIDILDGEDGSEFIEVKLNNGVANPVKLGAGLKKYDSMVVLTHFKGHCDAGYGGVFKNLGMGLGSRAGKLHMHADVRPCIGEKCVGCGICLKYCNAEAINILDGKAQINKDKCEGCAMCIAACPNNAVQIPWGTSSHENVQKKIVDYAEGVMKVVPCMIFINVLENITKECDCFGIVQKPVVEDIGIVAGYDPVSVDKASLDLVRKSPEFEKINDINKDGQVDYAEEKGLGKKEYKLIRL
jgi:uncharacterized protein